MAVKVIPPSDELTGVSVPLGMVKSALVKPVTASEKVIVTVGVSPDVTVVSSITTVAVGAKVSIEKLFEFVVPTPGFPDVSFTPVLSRVITLVASSTPAVGV